MRVTIIASTAAAAIKPKPAKDFSLPLPSLTSAAAFATAASKQPSSANSKVHQH